MQKSSFSPIIPYNPKVIILGSLPGDLSIASNEYYAHPQNRFWKILGNIFTMPTSGYAAKLQILETKQIALWDICKTADREGSMDTDIKAVVPNDILLLLKTYPTIRHIFFNGQKASHLFKKHILQPIPIPQLTLPSTSPANARYSITLLTDIWGEAFRNHLNK